MSANNNIESALVAHTLIPIDREMSISCLMFGLSPQSADYFAALQILGLLWHSATFSIAIFYSACKISH